MQALFTMFLGFSDSKANSIRQCSTILWQETRGRRAHASVDRVCEALRQRGYVGLYQEGALQAPRKLREPQQNHHEATLRAHRDGLGGV